MNLYEAIFARKSVRKYDFTESVPSTMMDRLHGHFLELNGLFGNMETDLTILDNCRGHEVKFGFPGIRAPYYMLFYAQKAPRYRMNAGYLMEQMALYLCSTGLGSCFIGTDHVRRSLSVKGEMELIGILAFGRAKGSPVRRPVEANRLSLDELCVYKEVPRQWVKQLLEAARMAPSVRNAQPWRFVVYDDRIHIFSKKHRTTRMSKWDEVNFGVMFANLMVTAEELWLDVDLIRLENISQKNFKNTQYVLSALLRA